MVSIFKIFCVSSQMKKYSWFNLMTVGALFMSFVSKCFSLMELCMISVRHDLKIFYRVIKSVSIKMMNRFISLQFSTKKVLHNQSMFGNCFFVNPKVSIPIFSDMTAPFWSNKRSKWISVTSPSLIMSFAVSSASRFSGTIFNGAGFHKRNSNISSFLCQV